MSARKTYSKQTIKRWLIGHIHKHFYQPDKPTETELLCSFSVMVGLYGLASVGSGAILNPDTNLEDLQTYLFTSVATNSNIQQLLTITNDYTVW